MLGSVFPRGSFSCYSIGNLEEDCLRMQVVGILEHTQTGELVVCDRYLFSNLAYQSSECGSSLPEELNKSFPLPQIVFYFDLSKHM